MKNVWCLLNQSRITIGIFSNKSLAQMAAVTRKGSPITIVRRTIKENTDDLLTRKAKARGNRDLRTD